MSKYKNAPQTLLSGWTVLAIDDHEDSQEVIEDILTFYGATVVLADDGQEGFERALKVQPQFIISDISMPNVDGWQLIEMLKAEPRTMHIPVIALTAHAMAGDRERAIGVGFHNYLSKPLDPFNFLSQVLTLLDDIDALAHELQTRMKAV
ncbi:MAG: response regulator [Chloroflexota bacterium]